MKLIFSRPEQAQQFSRPEQAQRSSGRYYTTAGTALRLFRPTRRLFLSRFTCHGDKGDRSDRPLMDFARGGFFDDE
jgi:hypothetical protein